MADPVGPCPDPCLSWCDVADLPESCSDVAPDVAELYVMAATGLLYEWSGRQFPGSCQDTVRPVIGSCYSPLLAWDGWRGASWQEWSPTWGHCGCNGYGSDCCPTPPQIDLGRVVTSIVQVTVDGAVLPDSAYQIEGFRYLQRIDGEGWPTCQRLDLPTTEDRTFEIVYTYGITPPDAGRVAAIRLASEMIAGLCGLDSCTLPKRVQQIVREGVTAVFVDPFFKNSASGLYEVSVFLDAYNPQALTRAASIAGPDTPDHLRRITG